MQHKLFSFNSSIAFRCIFLNGPLQNQKLFNINYCLRSTFKVFIKEYTASFTEVTELSLAGSLDVNFYLLKNFEDKKTQINEVTWTTFSADHMAAQELQLYSTATYNSTHIFLKFSHLRFLWIEKYIMIQKIITTTIMIMTIIATG